MTTTSDTNNRGLGASHLAAIVAAAAGVADDPAMSRAQLALTERRIEEALERFNAILAEYPTRAEAYNGRGQCYALLDEPERALADFERAAMLAPREPEAWFLRARLAQSRRDFERALRDLERANELRPEARTWFAIGQIQAELGDDFEAIDAYGRAYELDHRCVDALVERGRLFMTHECHVAALADFASCCLLQPGVAQHLVARGNANYELGEHELAVRDYEAALAIQRDLPEVFLNLGCIALDNDELPRAIQHLNQAIAMDGSYARAFLNRGLAHFYRGHDSGAEKDLLRATEIDAQDPDALFALGRLYARQNRLGPATERIAQALERCPDYVDEVLGDELFVELRKLSEVKRIINRAHEQLG